MLNENYDFRFTTVTKVFKRRKKVMKNDRWTKQIVHTDTGAHKVKLLEVVYFFAIRFDIPVKYS